MSILRGRGEEEEIDSEAPETHSENVVISPLLPVTENKELGFFKGKTCSSKTTCREV